jgi:beta-galactosidase beta subunit
MDLTQLSNVLTKVYNTVGNRYITDNFISEPFEFKVKVRYGDPYEYHKYYVDVYSIPDMPEFFKYTPELRKKEKKDVVGADVNVIGIKFKSLIEYVDNERKGLIGVNFMNVKKYF